MLSCYIHNYILYTVYEGGKASHVMKGEHHGCDDADDHEQHGQDAQEATARCKVHLQGVTQNTNVIPINVCFES